MSPGAFLSVFFFLCIPIGFLFIKTRNFLIISLFLAVLGWKFGKTHVVSREHLIINWIAKIGVALNRSWVIIWIVVFLSVLIFGYFFGI